MLNRVLPSALVLLVLACTPPGPVPATKVAPPFVPTLSLRPVGVSLGRQATQAFQAELNQPEGARFLRQPVTWMILEPGGGTITPEGLYTAPAAAGTYHVKVQREDFPGLSATATVLVK
jgi:hypothetical protein